MFALLLAALSTASASDGYAFTGVDCTGSSCSVVSDRSASTWSTTLPTLSRVSAGYYRLTMPGAGNSEMNVQVSTDQFTSNLCKLSSASQSGSSELVYVRCYSSSGSASDTDFVIAMQSQTSPSGYSRLGYANSTSATPASPYTPSSSNWFNSSGGSLDIERVSTGKYYVDYDGWSSWSALPFVTATGANSKQCKPHYVGPSGSVTDVTVDCWSGTSRSDSTFSTALVDERVLFMGDEVSESTTWGAYGLCDARTASAGTTVDCDADLSWANFGGDITVTRLGTGLYELDLSAGGALWDGSARVFLAQAYGTDATMCRTSGWGEVGTGAYAYVACTSGTSMADSRFVFMAMSDATILY